MKHMAKGQLAFRSLAYYWRTNFGVVMGVLLASSVLVAALTVGDSVRTTLREIGQARLGRVTHVLAPMGQALPVSLADRLAQDTPAATGLAPTLLLEGLATTPDESARAGGVQILGVDARFFALGPMGQPLDGPPPDETYLNEGLASSLGVGVGDDVVLVMSKPSLLPREAPLARTSDRTVVMNLRVARVLTPAQFGRFGLTADPVAPPTAYVNLATLGVQAELAGKANLFLVGSSDGDALATALDRVWTLADSGLEVVSVPALPVLSLQSDSVFLSAAVLRAARQACEGQAVLTYLVNGLRAGEKTTPYSMVAAVEPGGLFGLAVPADLRDDEIVINEWLAKDLEIAAGDALELTYFVLKGSALVEARRSFRVRAVSPIQGVAADRTLMPNFPGIGKADHCREWDAGAEFDLEAVRDKDEAYWDTYRGTPKAFVTYAAGRSMWANRFGEATAYRAARGEGVLATPATMTAAIRAKLGPADLGLVFRDVGSDAQVAASEAMDFGGLFLGLGGFLLLAALLLTGLLFALGLEQRREELGTLRAMGFSARQVRRQFLVEAGLLAGLGAVLGGPVGLLLSWACVTQLGGIWSGAVAGFPVQQHWSYVSIATGVAGAWLAAMGVMLWRLRAARRASVQSLLSGVADDAAGPSARTAKRTARLAVCCAVGAVALAASASLDVAFAAGPGAFFAAGGLMLLATCFAAASLLGRHARARGASADAPRLPLRFVPLLFLNLARRRGRTLASVALLATGVFLTLSIGVFRLAPPDDPTDPSCGTGGFTLFGQSDLPVLDDLNDPAGREAMGLGPVDLAGARIVPLRVRLGDDASCRNLHRPGLPTLLGVDPARMTSAGVDAFGFVQADKQGGWAAVLAPRDDGTIPIVLDEPTATWALQVGLGDTIEMTDQHGQNRLLRVAGLLPSSILQGKVLLAEQAFTGLFPAEVGHRAFLVATTASRTDAVRAALTRAGGEVGLAVERTELILGRFQEVQNTYLTIFTALGVMAMLLGTAGFGIVVLRNVLERRGELAMWRAVGFSHRQVRRAVVLEHGVLATMGLASGAIASAVAIWPTLVRSGQVEQVLPMWLGLAAGLLGSGLLWASVASLWATRGPLVEALREE